MCIGQQESLEYIDWYIRDFPYGYAGLMEMLLDPSHCPFTLHGIGLFNRHVLLTSYRPPHKSH